jgi:DNA-binding FrmR family transcriptional regulator
MREEKDVSADRGQHGRPRPHVHSHEDKKAVLNRLNRAAGHLESVKRMIENDRDCSEVIVQIAAVRAAVSGAGKLMIQHHIKHCIVDAVKHNDTKRIDDLNNAIEKFLK